MHLKLIVLKSNVCIHVVCKHSIQLLKGEPPDVHKSTVNGIFMAFHSAVLVQVAKFPLKKSLSGIVWRLYAL